MTSVLIKLHWIDKITNCALVGLEQHWNSYQTKMLLPQIVPLTYNKTALNILLRNLLTAFQFGTLILRFEKSTEHVAHHILNFALTASLYCSYVTVNTDTEHLDVMPNGTYSNSLIISVTRRFMSDNNFKNVQPQNYY